MCKSDLLCLYVQVSEVLFSGFKFVRITIEKRVPVLRNRQNEELAGQRMIFQNIILLKELFLLYLF